MDKENNNNSIEDILRLLKDKVENTESADAEIKENTENLDTESLKERLKEQYSVAENAQTDETKHDEYALDESFALIEEDVEDSISEFTQPLETLEEDSDALAEDLNDTEVQSETESEVTVESEIKSEEVKVDISSEETYSISPEYIEMIEELVEAKSQDAKSEKTDKAVLADEDDDDVPWFEDDVKAAVSHNESSSSVIFIDLPDEDNEDFAIQVDEEAVTEDEQITEEEQIHNEYVSDELKLISDDLTSESDETLVEDTLSDGSDGDYADVSDTLDYDYSLEEEEQVHIASAEEKEESFYRTITTAEHETLAKRAAMRNLDEVMVDDSFEDRFVDGEYDFDGEEEKDILAANKEKVADGDVEDGVEDAFVLQNSFEKKYGISTDFLDSDVTESKSELAEELHTAEFDPEYEKEDEYQETVRGSFLNALKPYALGLLAMLIFALELLPPLDIVPKGLLDYTEHAVIYIILDLQLLFFAAAIYWKRLFDGVVHLFKSSANVYSILSLTLIISTLYSIVACFCTGSGMPKLYNSIVATYIFISYIIDRIDEKRVRRSVGELIAADKIFTLQRSHGKNSSADKMYLGGVAPDKNIYEPVGVCGTKYSKCFVNDRGYTKDKTVIYALTPVLIFSMLIAVSAMMLGEDFSYVINSMMVTFVTLAPLSAVISSFLPIFMSYKRLQSRGCIIPSYRAARSVADCDALIFSDSHLFKDAVSKDNGIKIYDQTKTAEVLSCLDTVYGAIGGPMEKIFSGANSSQKKRNINIVRITRSGIEAVIDGKTSIILGNSDYLMRYGISTDFSSEKKNSLGLIYVAMNSRLVASLSLSYKTEPLFEMLCEFMGDNGIDTVIGTYDPVISSAFVAQCRKNTPHEYPVSVVHKNKNDYYKNENADVSSVKSRVFAISSRLKLVEIAVFCKRIINVSKIYSFIRSASFILAVLLSAVFTISGIMDYVNLLWVLVYQLLLVISFILVAHRWMPSSFEDEKNKKAE